MKGEISIKTENIFPVIKKWLYSDKDIFLREIVSNACDAVAKHKRLVETGDVDDSDGYCVDIVLDQEKKTITVSDNGIGMTADEIERYIAQLAFSGAEEFLEKYKDTDDVKSQIIGHFGLGFYSSFMVCDLVEIESKSFENDSEAAHWSCDGGTEYELTKGTREQRGTDIIMHISDDNSEFLDFAKLREVLVKYCAFLPVEIFLSKIGEEPSQDPINDTEPLWLKKPSECTDQQYIEFYNKVFFDFNPPLFWVHLNVDYPFNLQGILYFPKLRHEFETSEGQIKLYNNQVFVADNIKEVIPEFLLLLKGCIDCPDLPLNVSRSFLQNDGYVTRVSAHITKKVADKLTSIFQSAREDFNKYWDDINPFVKYGCLRDNKFYDKVKDLILFKTDAAEYLTKQEYIQRVGENCIYYCQDVNAHSSYIALYKQQDIPVVVLPTMIDTHFISFLEATDSEVKFKRIDSSVDQGLASSEPSDDCQGLLDAFKAITEGQKIKIEAKEFRTENPPALALLDETSRRMEEMSKMFGGGRMAMPVEKTICLNLSNPLVKSIADNLGNDAMIKPICEAVVDMAMLSHNPLDSARMEKLLGICAESLAEQLKN